MKLIAAAAVALASVAPIPAKALDCFYIRSGERLCIHSVYSFRRTSIKEVTMSVEGSRPNTFRIDCSRPDWEFNSLFDRVCSQYSESY